MNPSTLKLHADALAEIPPEDTRAILRQAADALEAAQDLAHAVEAAFRASASDPVSKVYSTARRILLDRAAAVLEEPEDQEPDEDPRPGTPEAARLRRNIVRHPAEWGEAE